MFKQIKSLILLLIFILIFASCNNKTQFTDYKAAYELLNKYSFDFGSNIKINNLKEIIFQYSEEIKGDFNAKINDESIFPPELICLLEEALYNSCNYNPGKLLIAALSVIFEPNPLIL